MDNYPKYLIDVHSHVFNLRYIPIMGLARSKVPGSIGNAVAYLLNEMTQSSFPEPTGIDKALQSINQKELSGDHLEGLWLLFSYKLLQKTSQLQKTCSTPEEYQKDNFINAIKDIVCEYSREHPILPIVSDNLPATLSQSADSEKKLKEFFKALNKPIKWAFRKFARALEKAKVFGDDASDMLEFLSAMTKDEKSILGKLQKQYSDHKVDLFVHYMMDMEFGCEKKIPPFYPFFPDQCEKMSRLASDSDSSIIGFSAFDPNRSNWSEIYERALSLGFVGFKFYPSMGFLPIGNDDPVIEQRVTDFLLRCATDKIPIVTHCTPNGFQFQDGEGLKAHPKYWVECLGQAGFEKLKINFCHAGGGKQTNQNLTSPGWYAEPEEWDNENNFAKTVVQLCCNYENVYCDMSYLLKLYEESEEGRRIQVNFERNFLKQLRSGMFASKVMYGSDWNMPNIIDETDSYLNYFISLFSREAFKEYAEMFFWKNCLKFLDFQRYFERMGSLTPPNQHVYTYVQGLKKKVAQLSEI